MREERGVGALEGEAEGEEGLERIVIWGGEGEVLQAGERWERNDVTGSGYGSVLRYGDCEVLALWGGVVEGRQVLDGEGVEGKADAEI